MSLSSLFRKNNKQETQDDDNSFSRTQDESKPKRVRAKRKPVAGDETGDPVLPEKKRARRRLIGAVALVLAAIIGLPMVLDSEPKPIAQDIDIKIPSKDHAPAPRRVPQAAALDASEQIVEPTGTPAPEPRPAATPPAAPVAAAAEAQKVSTPTQQDKPAAADQVAAHVPVKAQIVDTPASKPAASPAKVAMADAHSTAKTESKPSSRPEARARDARENPKPAAASERDSERAMAILEGKGVSRPDTAKPASEHKPGKYSIQVAALSSQEKVNELRARLKAGGIASQTQKVPTANGERIRVRVGPFASKEEAEKMRARLVKMGLNGSLVPLGD